MADIAKQKGRDNFIARHRTRIQARSSRSRAPLEESSTTTSQHIAHNMCALRVPANHKFRIRALLSIRRDLVHAGLPPSLHSAAILRLERIIEDDVLVIAAAEPGADGVHELALAPRVRLVVAAREEDVGFRARSRPCRLRVDERQEEGCGEQDHASGTVPRHREHHHCIAPSQE